MAPIEHIQIITREQAIQQGLKYFFTGVPCKRGHIAKRSIKGMCIECRRYHLRKDQQTEKWKIANKRYRRSEKGVAAVARKSADRIMGNARQRVRLAIEKGILKRLPCERCGATHRVHGHHDDYSKPLEVTWLCPIHHAERHREMEGNL